MIPRSVRWRLPLSYAAIALLTVLCLGAVMLTALPSYYSQRELEYLTTNAEAISSALVLPLRLDTASRMLQLQIESFSFLSQTRVRMLDADGNVWLDSGTPTKVNVTFGMLANRESPNDSSGQPMEYTPFIFIGGEKIEPAAVAIRNWGAVPMDTSAPWSRVVMARDLAVVGTPYGFGMNPNAESGERRSDLVVRKAMYNAGQRLVGYIELSDGPAYGWDVIDSVTRGWAIAGGVAVVIAAIVGWVMSGRISGPVLALAQVTRQMAGGDLTARAAQSGDDEFGVLASSFNHMASRVEGTVATLRQFVADAAHELHTPLTALRTNLELAATARSADERMTLISDAEEQVERLEMLTTGLLDLSRLETGAMASGRRVLDLTVLVKEISEPYASRAEQMGQAFVLDVPAGPLWIHGEASQLARAVANLLDNAVKFTGEGGKVTLRLRRAGSQASLTVEDTGIGIPKEDLPRLFSRFHRGRNAASYPGSGLGLAIVKAIVEGHAGTIMAESVVQGARFVARLPLDDRSSTGS
jgi:signal transduction histidine kinase